MESGGRHLFDRLVPWLYEQNGEGIQIDLVTCFAGVPNGFQGNVYRVMDYGGRAGRKRLYGILREQKYTNIGIICSGEPIMTKWKWALATRVPAKLFILNENGDYFWFQWDAWRILRRLMLDRLGLSGSGAVTLAARVVAFPFTLVYLIAFAAYVHARRRIRLAMHGPVPFDLPQDKREPAKN